MLQITLPYYSRRGSEMGCRTLVAAFVVPFVTSLMMTLALYIIIKIQLIPAAMAPLFGILGGLAAMALIDILSQVFCR